MAIIKLVHDVTVRIYRIYRTCRLQVVNSFPILDSAVARALIAGGGGGGVHSYIRVIPD